ncbi:MAG: hypothetical protein K2X50_05190 [Gammaproteobacteria bacterium]|nr:hypothetical protein [Gammaproteobacteria bacterium]
MKISIIRVSINNYSITGELYIDGKFIAHTLELPYRDNKTDLSSIPPGTYSAFIRYDKSDQWRIQLTDTLPREGVQIHIGNYPREIKGCILVGQEVFNTNSGVPGEENRVAGSTPAYQLLKKAFYGSEDPVKTPNIEIQIGIYAVDTLFKNRESMIALSYKNNGKWAYHISNSSTTELIEIKRTEDSIFLKNDTNQFRIPISGGELKSLVNDRWETLATLFRSPNPLRPLSEVSEFTPYQPTRSIREPNGGTCQKRPIDIDLTNFLQAVNPNLANDYAKKVKKSIADSLPKAEAIEEDILLSSDPYRQQANRVEKESQNDIHNISEFLTIISSNSGALPKKELNQVTTLMKTVIGKELSTISDYRSFTTEFKLSATLLPDRFVTMVDTVYHSLEKVDGEFQKVLPMLDETADPTQLAHSIGTAAQSMTDIVSAVGKIQSLKENEVIQFVGGALQQVTNYADKANQAIENANTIRQSLNNLLDSSEDIYHGINKDAIKAKQQELTEALSKADNVALSISSKVDAFSKGATAFSALLSTVGCVDLANDFQVVAENGAAIASAITSIAAGTVSGAGMLGPYGAIAGAAISVFNHFGQKKNRKNDPNAVILKQIQALGEMINKLAIHIDQQFAQVGKMLNNMAKHFDARIDRLENIMEQMHLQINQRFDRLEDILDKRFDRIEEILGYRFDRIEQIIAAHNKLMVGRFERIEKMMVYIHRVSLEQFKQVDNKLSSIQRAASILQETANDIYDLLRIGLEANLLKDFNHAKFICLNQRFYDSKSFVQIYFTLCEYAIRFSAEELFSAKPGDLLKTLPTNLNLPIEKRINALCFYVNKHITHPVDSRNPLPNPAIWADAANTLIYLILKNPQFFAKNIDPTEQEERLALLNRVIDTGQYIQRFLYEIRCTPSLFHECFGHYKQILGQVLTKYEAIFDRNAAQGYSRTVFAKNRLYSIYDEIESRWPNDEIWTSKQYLMRDLFSDMNMDTGRVRFYRIKFTDAQFLATVKNTETNVVTLYIISLLEVNKPVAKQVYNNDQKTLLTLHSAKFNAVDIAQVNDQIMGILQFDEDLMIISLLNDGQIVLDKVAEVKFSYHADTNLQWLNQTGQFCVGEGWHIQVIDLQGIKLERISEIGLVHFAVFSGLSANLIAIIYSIYGYRYLSVWQQPRSVANQKYTNLIRSVPLGGGSFSLYLNTLTWLDENILIYPSCHQVFLVDINNIKKTTPIYVIRNDRCIVTALKKGQELLILGGEDGDIRYDMRSQTATHPLDNNSALNVDYDGTRIHALSNSTLFVYGTDEDYCCRDNCFTLINNIPTYDSFIQSSQEQEMAHRYQQILLFADINDVYSYYDTKINSEQRQKAKTDLIDASQNDSELISLYDKMDQAALILRSVLMVGFRDEFLNHASLYELYSLCMLTSDYLKNYLHEYNPNNPTGEFIITFVQRASYLVNLFEREITAKSNQAQDTQSGKSGYSIIDITLFKLESAKQRYFANTMEKRMTDVTESFGATL